MQGYCYSTSGMAVEVVTAQNRGLYKRSEPACSRTRHIGDILSTCYVCDPQSEDLKAAQSRRKATKNLCKLKRQHKARELHNVGAGDKIIHHITGTVNDVNAMLK